VQGSAALVVDVIRDGKSLLLLGRPGVGKTTAVREIARMLSGPGIGKRTVIIDTRLVAGHSRVQAKLGGFGSGEWGEGLCCTLLYICT